MSIGYFPPTSNNASVEKSGAGMALLVVKNLSCYNRVRSGDSRRDNVANKSRFVFVSPSAMMSLAIVQVAMSVSVHGGVCACVCLWVAVLRVVFFVLHVSGPTASGTK